MTYILCETSVYKCRSGPRFDGLDAFFIQIYTNNKILLYAIQVRFPNMNGEYQQNKNKIHTFNQNVEVSAGGAEQAKKTKDFELTSKEQTIKSSTLK